jgi:hypothetical protein
MAEHLDVVGVTGGLAGIDVNEHGHLRFCPDSDHRADVAGGPKGANNGLMQLQQDALVFSFPLEAMAAGSVQ